MNLAAWLTIVFGCLSILAQLLAAAVIYGKMSERTTNNTADISEIKPVVDRHDGEIGYVYGHLNLPR